MDRVPTQADTLSSQQGVQLSKSFDTNNRGWRDTLLGLRNRTLANPEFQRWVAGFPLTKGLASRRAASLFNIINGFVYAQVMVACVQLDLFERLRDGPRTVADLAPQIDLTEAATSRLLKAGASLGLFDAAGVDRFALGELGAAMLGNAAVLPMIAHHAVLYADLADPVALLRSDAGGRLARYWPYAASDDPAAVAAADTTAYSALMVQTQPMVAAQLLEAYPVARHRVLMDVGGGEGAFLIAAGGVAPMLQLRLFDLPPVAARGEARFAAAGLADRATSVGGSMFHDPLPMGSDLVSLVRVLHDHDDDAAMTLLRAVHAALPPGGTLLVGEPMAGTPGAEPMGEAYFGFYLWAMGSGRPRTPAEIAAMLRAAGFATARHIATRTPLTTQLIAATA
jgi:demethylspheroidene O-methyltransferase